VSLRRDIILGVSSLTSLHHSFSLLLLLICHPMSVFSLLGVIPCHPFYSWQIYPLALSSNSRLMHVIYKCICILHPEQGLQSGVAYLGWPITPSYVSPNAGGGSCGSQTMSTAVYRSPNKLCRSNSIFNLYPQFSGHLVRTYRHLFSLVPFLLLMRHK